MAAEKVIPQKMIDECMERLLPDENDRADPMKRFNALVSHVMSGAGTVKKSDDSDTSKRDDRRQE